MPNQDKLKQFTEEALKQGYSLNDVATYLNAREKTESIFNRLQRGISLEDYQLEQGLKEYRGKKEIEYEFKQEHPEETSQERERKIKFEDLSTSLDLLEKNLREAEQRGPLMGRFGLWAAGATGGGQFPEIADFEALRKGLIGPVARAISGEVGVLTDRDIARAEKLLPSIIDDPQLARRKIANLRSLISERLGKQGEATKETEVTSQLESSTGLAKILPALGLAAGTGLSIVPPIGPLAFLKPLGLAGRMALGGGIAGATQPAESFIQRLQQASTGAVIGGTTGKLAGPLLKILRPFKAIGEYRAAKIAEATGKKISGTKIYSALKEGFNLVSPTSRSAYERYLTNAAKTLKGKTLSVDDAVKLQHEANAAFTAAGQVGKAASARFNKILGDALREQMKITAPAVAKANKLFEYLYRGQKEVRRWAFPAAIAGGATAGGAFLIDRLLRGR